MPSPTQAQPSATKAQARQLQAIRDAPQAQELRRRLALIECEKRGIKPPERAAQSVGLAGFVESTTRFKLEPWQETISRRLEVLPEQRGQRLLIHGFPQAGKPCYNECMVLLADGSYRPLGDVQIGDLVITDKGRARRVVAVHEQGDLECVEIVTANGRRTVAAVDHPFLTPEGWVEAAKLRAEQALACVPEAECGSSCPERSALEFELLGYFVGDGSTMQGNCAVTSNDPEQGERMRVIAEALGFEIRTATKQKTTALTYHFKGGARAWIRDSGIKGLNSHHKRVPEWVFRGNREQIGAFLGAYFSCDGTVSAKGLDRHGNMRPDAMLEFFSTSEGLLKDIQSLLLRVGVQSRLIEKNGRYRGERHRSWRLNFASQDNVAQFRDRVPVPGEKGHKLALLRPQRRGFQPPFLADPVVSITPVGLKPCRCLTVEEDHTFTVDDLVVHNSILVSQRFPAYSIGKRPDLRFRLSCYNETHAERFSRVNLAVMRDPAFARMFPEVGLPPPNCSAKEWYTTQRRAARDGQPSFVALGIGSGFVGMGADLLVIDDPYKNREEAFSDVTNENVWLWWSDVVLPRLNPDTNVVVMFHRWRSNDLAGRLLEQGGWELLRFPAIADGLEGDCSGLEVGEPLSPRYSIPFLRNVESQQGSLAFNALYQGNPGDATGNLIKADYFRPYWRDGDFYCLQRGDRVERVRASDVWRFTTVDWASSDAKTADWTVATTWGVTPRNDLLTLAVKRGREEGPEAKSLVRTELVTWEPVFVVVEKNGLGLPMTQDLQREGWPIRGVWQHTKKEVRAQGLAVAYENGRVFHPREAEWLQDWTKELLAFPAGANDDQLDTGSLAARAVVASNAVIRDFSPSLHVSLDSLPYDARYGFVVGWAASPVPACVIGQVQGAQLLLYVGEVATSGEGLEAFILRMAGMLATAGGRPVQQLTLKHFASKKVLDDGLGPVFYAAGLQGDSRPQFALGKIAEEQPNRDEAIRRRCQHFTEGRPDFLISPKAEELQAALSVGYVYRTDQQGLPQPATEPNSAQALCEALGCLCVAAQGVLAVAQNAVAEHLKQQKRQTPATRGMGSRGRSR